MTRKRRQMFYGDAMYIGSNSQKESRYFSSPVFAVAFGGYKTEGLEIQNIKVNETDDSCQKDLILLFLVS